MEKKECLTRSEEDLDEKEKKARMDVEVADELLNEASSKLDDALSSTPLNKTSVTVAKMMLDTAKEKCQRLWTPWIISESKRNHLMRQSTNC